ncbi:MAG: PIG-L family deacetylase [Halieaceae bacterium]
MELDCPKLDIFVPDNMPLQSALDRTTHMGIGAHADDLEILAFHGIGLCHDDPRHWFSGVVISDGAGSPRDGRYRDFSAAEMMAQRQQEQRDAAALGGYSLQLQLGYSSAAVRSEPRKTLVPDLVAILQQCQPQVLYLHNLADAHATHRAAANACIDALRELEPAALPAEIYGVEVWRSLDWLPEQYRSCLPIEDEQGLQAQLLRCHDSQIGGGKRYDEAIIARQRANATLTESQQVDTLAACALAMNLRPLIDQPSLSTDAFLQECLGQFSEQLLAAD